MFAPRTVTSAASAGAWSDRPIVVRDSPIVGSTSAGGSSPLGRGGGPQGPGLAAVVTSCGGLSRGWRLAASANNTCTSSTICTGPLRAVKAAEPRRRWDLPASALRVAGYARAGWGGASRAGHGDGGLHRQAARLPPLRVYADRGAVRRPLLSVALALLRAPPGPRPLSVLRRPVGRHTRMDKMDDRSAVINLAQLFCNTHSRYS